MAEATTIYNDGEIHVALMRYTGNESVYHVGLRWLEPRPSRGRSGEAVATTNIMGGATDWFLLPHSLGVAVAKTLLERHLAGLIGFDPEGGRDGVARVVGEGAVGRAGDSEVAAGALDLGFAQIALPEGPGETAEVIESVTGQSKLIFF